MTKHRWVFKPPIWLTLVTLLGVTLLCSLGFWQLARGQQKIALQNQLALASEKAPLDKIQLLAGSASVNPKQMRYLPVKLKGEYLNQYNILLDNKIEKGHVGYHLLTPIALDAQHWLLVDRGFIPLGTTRAHLPKIPPLIGEVTIEGYLDFSYRNPFISTPLETEEIQWPLRMQHPDTELLGTLWNKKVYPMLVVLNLNKPNTQTWLSPQKHQGYAVQWFGLGLTLLLFYFISQLRRENNVKNA
jgi:surfeit locus 1 family protein